MDHPADAQVRRRRLADRAARARRAARPARGSSPGSTTGWPSGRGPASRRSVARCGQRLARQRRRVRRLERRRRSASTRRVGRRPRSTSPRPSSDAADSRPSSSTATRSASTSVGCHVARRRAASSSRSSSPWAKRLTASKPTTAAAPFSVCTSRKISATVSASAPRLELEQQLTEPGQAHLGLLRRTGRGTGRGSGRSSARPPDRRRVAAGDGQERLDVEQRPRAVRRIGSRPTCPGARSGRASSSSVDDLGHRRRAERGRPVGGVRRRRRTPSVRVGPMPSSAAVSNSGTTSPRRLNTPEHPGRRRGHAVSVVGPATHLA